MQRREHIWKWTKECEWRRCSLDKGDGWGKDWKNQQWKIANTSKSDQFAWDAIRFKIQARWHTELWAEQQNKNDCSSNYGFYHTIHIHRLSQIRHFFWRWCPESFIYCAPRTSFTVRSSDGQLIIRKLWRWQRWTTIAGSKHSVLGSAGNHSSNQQCAINFTVHARDSKFNYFVGSAGNLLFYCAPQLSRHTADQPEPGLD